MAYGWEDLDHLAVVDVEYTRAAPVEVEETPAVQRIRQRQEAFFNSEFPAQPPVVKVVVTCQSVDPQADRQGHECTLDEEDMVRHGTRPFVVRDRRVATAPTFLRINRVRFFCRTCRRAFPEVLPDIHPNHRITRRLHRDLTIASLNRPFAEVAQRQSVTPKLVQIVFHEYREAMLSHYEADLPEVLAVDETHLLGDTRFVLSDLKEGKILDIAPKNTRTEIRTCLASHSYHFNVRVFVQDMSQLYRAVANEFFPDADIVVDKFHVIQLATYAMNNARNAFAGALPRRQASALRQNAKLFNKNRWTLTEKQRELLAEIKEFSPDLARAHMLMEEFGRIYQHKKQSDAERAFDEWAARLEDRNTRHVNRHFKPLRKTIGGVWRTEVFNFWQHQFTNAFVERMNRNLREINRFANGLSIETLRAKALLKYGHFHLHSEIANYDLSSVPTAEVDAVLNHRLWEGFSADTLARSLRAGMFEGRPPKNSQRPVVLPDGSDHAAAETRETPEASPRVPAALLGMQDDGDPRPVQRTYYGSKPRHPLGTRTVHRTRRMIDGDYVPATHFRSRGRGHGGGRNLTLNGPSDYERWQMPKLSPQADRKLRKLLDPDFGLDNLGPPPPPDPSF